MTFRLRSHRLAAVGLSAAALIVMRPARAEPPPPSHGHDIRQTKIADGIYQFTTVRDAYVRQLTSVVIVNHSDVIVFDTNTRPSSARLILAEIRKITNKPVRYLVNSHWHPDHWSGNDVYVQAFPGLDIIATEIARQTMQTIADSWPAKFRGELAKSQAALAHEIETGKVDDGSPLSADQRRRDEDDVRNYGTFVDEAEHLVRVYPTLTYVDHLTMFHGGRELRFMSVTGDAEGTTVLYLPREKVLITGDAVSYPIPYVTPPPTRHLASLRALAALDVDVIIPGHGPAFHDKAFLGLEAELIDSVLKGVKAALQKRMLSLDEVQRAVTVEELRDRFTHGDPDLDNRFRDRVKVLVKLAVREARDGQDLP